jgi:ferrous iron transport protein B
MIPPNGRPVIALLGNPNTGKTTLFNALAGMRQRVGNYPGVTVETKKGQMTHAGRTFDLIDLPGTYSLAARSPDEMVAVDLILGQQPGEPRPDVVLSIVDASNLERNLYLTTQALEMGVPVVVALNMMDVAEGQGLRLDVARLTKQLGVPVVPIQANKGRGLDRLREVLAAAATASDKETNSDKETRRQGD